MSEPTDASRAVAIQHIDPLYLAVIKELQSTIRNLWPGFSSPVQLGPADVRWYIGYSEHFITVENSTLIVASKERWIADPYYIVGTFEMANPEFRVEQVAAFIRQAGWVL